MRVISFLTAATNPVTIAGLVLAVAVYSFAAPADDLCVNGHPAHRHKNITYGGLHVIDGFERDHIIPLCLGGPDTYNNTQYQTWEQANAKDYIERLECRAYCRGDKSLEAARRVFTQHKGEW